MSKVISAGLAVHLAASVHSARRRYRKRLARCQGKFSEAAVHELRIETRRTLALLDLLDAIRFTVPPEKVAKSFKRRLDVFADLRDTQVQLRLLKPMWREFPEAKSFHTFLSRREQRLVARLAQRIQGTKYARLNRRLKEIEKSILKSRKAGKASAVAALRVMFQRVVTLRRQVNANNPTTIHRMRVAFKRFRYVSELLQPLVPGFTAERLERMKEYQAAAGDIQDIEVLLARLAQVVKDRKVNPAAIRNLRSAFSLRRRQTIAAFMARIDDLSEFQPKAPRTAARKT